MRSELWIKLGQSNAAGNDKNNVIDYYGVDKPHPRIFEYSRGINKDQYTAAPSGELHVYRHPGQDTTRVSFGLEFCKRRLELNKDISKIVIINGAQNGTGFTNNYWNPGDTLYNNAVTYLTTALENHPDLVPTGILWHGGEIDAGILQATYESYLAAMANGLKGSISTGSQMMFVVGTMVESWISGDEVNRRPIDLAHRNVSNYIDNAEVVDLSDITDLYDFLHFSADSLREIGKRYADVAQDIVVADTVYYPRKLVAKTSVFDEWTRNKEFYCKIGNDPIRETVLDVKSNPTSIELRPDEYTLAFYVKIDDTPASSGRIMYGDTFELGYAGLTHGSTTIFTSELQAALVVDQWVHIVVTFESGSCNLYIGGVLDATAAMAEDISGTSQIFLGDSDETYTTLLDNVIALPNVPSSILSLS